MEKPWPNKNIGSLTMTWTVPEACEVCVGMEVTSYMSAEI
ncbi:pyrroloquinoline quinone precursor peptide PqqA [Rhodoblastus acidophilus]|nr:pyrroloquinoline quinone precursor peptide PqqA [Rhodoblastus acidophilus]RAI22396.1 pyrroloquinoline quinone precursor peptide PqqA [Rhodoblastus acidophilus]